MRVHLFNDKQVKTITKSVNIIFSKTFNKAADELKGLLDAEKKRLAETDSEVTEYKEKRDC